MIGAGPGPGRGARAPRRSGLSALLPAAATLALGGGALLSGAVGAGAQELRVELKAGAAVGNYTDTEAGLELVPGPSFGALLELWPTETLAGYVAFTRASFGCEEGFCTGRDVSLTSQGLVVGGRWSPGLPWVRAGLAVQSLDVDATGAEESLDPGLGVEVGAGVEFRVGQLFRIRPGITYMRHAASTDLGEGHVALLALEIGAAVDLHGF